jgi:hypothetical protein
MYFMHHLPTYWASCFFNPPSSCCQFFNSQSKPNYSAAFLQSTTDVFSLVFAEPICLCMALHLDFRLYDFHFNTWHCFLILHFLHQFLFHLTLCKYLIKKWYKRKNCCEPAYIQRIAKYWYMHQLVRRKTTCSLSTGEMCSNAIQH